MNGLRALGRRIWNGLLLPALLIFIVGAILCGALLGLMSAAIGVVYLAAASPMAAAARAADPLVFAAILIAAAILSAAAFIAATLYLIYLGARRRPPS